MGSTTSAQAVGTSTADVHLRGAGATHVAAAGDVNGDGIDDLITCGDGNAYVVFGSASTADVEVDGSVTQSGTSTVRGYRIELPGPSVNVPDGDADLGDVNGDGLADFVLVQVTYHDGTGAVTGKVWVIFGKSTTSVQSLADVGSGGYAIGPERSIGGFLPGLSVDAAGDINHDGRGDVLIGNRVDAFDGARSGEAYAVYGKGSPGPVDVTTMEPADGFRIHGSSQGSGSLISDVGWSVAGLGKIDDDQFGDLAVSTSNGVYVVFGRSDVSDVYLSDIDAPEEPLDGEVFPLASVVPPTRGFRIFDSDSGILTANSDTYGTSPLFDASVAGGGDFGGDGRPDILIGSLEAAYVVYGKGSTSDVDVADWPGLSTAEGWAIAAARPDLGVGFRTIEPPAIPGDLIADAHKDLLLAAPTARIGSGAGSLFLVAGGDYSGTGLNACEMGLRGVRFDVDTGSGPGTLGQSLAGETDFNDDERPDLIASNWHSPEGIEIFVGPGLSNPWTAPSCQAPDPEWVIGHTKPHVLLDASERWHPLDVDEFLGELFDDPENDPPDQIRGAPLPDTHLGCGPSGCHSLLGPSDLDNVDDSFIDVRGNPDNPESYRKPRCSWLVKPDCYGFGPEGAILNPYADVYENSLVHDGYQYVNYFWFFRFNDVPAVADDLFGGDHEGDWEGVSVAIDLTNTATIAFAIHEAHGTPWRYLSDVIRCGGPLAQPRSCGYPGRPGTSTRVNAYVASGTHANYPTPCGAACFRTSPTLPVLGTSFVPENPFGGETEANMSDTPSKPLSGEGWLDFPGTWGSNGGSPTGPKFKSRYTAPWDSQCTTRFSAEACPMSATFSTAQSGNPPPSLAAAACDPWFGPTINVVACQPADLRAALDGGGVEVPSSLELDGPPESQTAVGNGIAQMQGAPLVVGQKLDLRNVAAGTYLGARLLANDGSVKVASFRIPASGDAQLRAVPTALGPTLVAEASGAQIPEVGSYTIRPST